MTKSKKRRAAEERKTAEQAAILAAQPKAEWAVVEAKNIGFRPDEIELSKPYVTSIPAASGKLIKKYHPAIPGMGTKTILRRITFPCSRIILVHVASGQQVKLTYSEITRKCATHTAQCENCGGTGVATSRSFGVVALDDYGEPIGTVKRMGPATFARYALARFGHDSFPELLQALSVQSD